jgi:hypothetical protein
MKASLVALLIAAGAMAADAPVDLTRVRDNLRNVVAAQEMFFADNGKYASDLAALKMTVSDSVVLKIVTYTPTAYAVSGTLKGVEGVSCVMHVGNLAKLPVTAKGKVADKEGAVVCDE